MLTSKKAGNILVIFLKVGLFLSLFSLLGSTIMTLTPNWYDAYFSSSDDFITLFNILLWILTILVFFTWLYQVHLDVRKFDPVYPIKPTWSICSFIIPFYSLYGIWNVFSKLAAFFITDGRNATKEGQQLRAYLPWYYLVFFMFNMINRVIEKMPDVVNALFILSSFIEALFTLICLQMTRTIISGLEALSHSTPESHGQENTDSTFAT